MCQKSEEKSEDQKDSCVKKYTREDPKKSVDEKDGKKVDDSKVRINDPLNSIVGLIDIIKNIFR